MPQISGPNLQENHVIETCKEEVWAVSTQETAARIKWEMEHLTRLSVIGQASQVKSLIANNPFDLCKEQKHSKKKKKRRSYCGVAEAPPLFEAGVV
jgi:hypothetical protein